MTKKPKKIWLIIGHKPARNLKEYDYETDPRYYDLPGFESMTDEKYSADSNRVKVFSNKDDAIDFVYECGLVSTMIIGFRLKSNKYIINDKITNEVLNTDW